MYSVEKTKGINLFKRFDYPLFGAVLTISAIGIIVLSSAVKVLPSGNNGDRILLTQTIGLVLGVLLSIAVSMIDYKDFKTLGVILYIISITLLVGVLFFGVDRQTGSRSWFSLPFIGSFQPSEVAKITFIIVVSVFLERIKDGQKDIKLNIFKLAFYSVIPVALILKQPDFGTAMVFIIILCVMIYICGLPYKYIFGSLLLSIPLLGFMWFVVLEKFQKNRILSFFSPEEYAQGSAYNVLRSKIAIGSGQIFGKGLYQGIQTQHGGVPIKVSDFIFSVVGEELGFIGTSVIVILILFILLRCIYIAKNSRDLYGSFLVIGITAMFTFHFVENVGMCIGILPVTGIPLPFISSGGSAMVSNYIAIGIILSVSMRRRKVIFNTSE